MREIKFRGKRIDNGEWVYGGFYQDSDGFPFIIEHIENEGHFFVGVHPDTVGQFTGLLDKNGVEIYENSNLRFVDKWEWYRSSNPFPSQEKYDAILNDHVKYPYEERTVSLPEDYDWLLSSEIQQYWEVIGSIHDKEKK